METDEFYNYGVANLDTVYNSGDPWTGSTCSTTRVGRPGGRSLGQHGGLERRRAAGGGDAGRPDRRWRRSSWPGAWRCPRTRATSLGNAGNADAGTLDAADTVYASAVAAAENGQASSQATADAAHANRLAQAQSDFEFRTNTVNIECQEGFGTGTDDAVPGLA